MSAWLSRRPHFWGFLILWIPYLPLVLAGRTFLLGDCGTFELPTLTYLFQHGGEHWYPWSNGGMSTSAYLLGRIYYLPQIFFALGAPAKLGLFYFLLHQLIAFFAALTYLSHRSFSPTPALMGALTYAGSTAVIQLGLNYVFLPMLALAPLVLYALETMLQRPGPRVCFGLSFLVAMVFSGGSWVVLHVFGVTFVVAVALDHLWVKGQGLPGRACLAWLSLAALLAFLYWLPMAYSLTSNYLTGPVRASDLSPEMGGRFGVSDQLPLQTVYPLFYGSLEALSEKLGHTNHEFIMNVGAAFFPLFLLGLRPLPQRRRWVAVWLTVMFMNLFFSFGGENPVYRFLQESVPGLAKLRGPLRILFPFPLVSMALVASGMEALQGRRSSLWLVLVVYYVAYLVWGRPDFQAAHFLLLLSLFSALGYCRWLGRVRMASLLVAAICQSAAPVLFVEREYYSDASTWNQEVRFLQELKGQLENPLVGLFYAINAETAAMADVRTVTGISPVMNRGFVEYLFFALYGRTMTAEEFEHLRWQSFCASSLLAAEPIAGSRWSGPMMQMLSLRFLVVPEGVLPLHPHFSGFWLSRSAAVEADRSKVLARISPLDYDPRAQVFLDREPLLQPGYSSGQPGLLEYTPSRFTLSLNGAGGWLVVSSLYDPGWHARVDGREVPLFRANTIFLAAPIEPGSQRVEFFYRDDGRSTFGWCPWLACLGWALLIFLGRKRSPS